MTDYDQGVVHEIDSKGIVQVQGHFKIALFLSRPNFVLENTIKRAEAQIC